MFEDSLFLFHIHNYYVYKYVSRETLKRVEHRYVPIATRIKVVGV